MTEVKNNNRKMCGIILPSHFKTFSKFEEVHKRVNELGYRSISEYIYTKCFTGTHTSGCEMARDLNVSDMTIFHKKKIMQNNMNIEASKRENKPKYHEGDVHWVFNCGCEYKGQRYRVKNKRICIKHGESLSMEYKICQEKKCGVTFEVGPKYGARVFCDDCIVKRRENHFKKRRQRRKVKSDGICSRPGCGNSKPLKNRFLCDACKQKGESDINLLY
ncbi:MAG: hypothetical protein GY714_19800 [Desulfobacterales bacterium]|nr:hypothetical protein [Desulfobacterales bacterium]MCP4163342.1 hypothetical protein [Deltaproteobacteria bacterium]